jgi:hypothetical protein
VAALTAENTALRAQVESLQAQLRVASGVQEMAPPF